MATQNKITELIASIKTIYPYYAKDTDVTALVRTWALLLKDYPDQAVEVAFYKCLQTCKHPPTPADVIEHLRAMIDSTEPTDAELWDIAAATLREMDKQKYYFRFNYVDASGMSQGERAMQTVDRLWDGLPQRVKRYFGSKNEMLRISGYTADELKFEKTRFFKVMPTIKKREEYATMTALLGGGLDNLLIEGGGK